MENWFLLYAAIGVWSARTVVIYGWHIRPRRKVYLAMLFSFLFWPMLLARIFWASRAKK